MAIIGIVSFNFTHPIFWMLTLHILVSFLGLAIRSWKEPLLHRFRMVGVGGLVAVLSLHLDVELVHANAESLWSLAALVFAFCLMVAAHKFSSHKNHHVDCCEGASAHPFVSYWWIAALLVHSMTDGYLLSVSEGFAPNLRDSVWAFLVVHKLLEAVWVSSLLAIEFRKRTLLALIGAYVLTFPLGYFIPLLLRNGSVLPGHNLEMIFEVAGALSMGSLLACVLVDQLIPAFKNIRKEFTQVLWFILGFALTHGVLFLTGGAHEHHVH